MPIAYIVIWQRSLRRWESGAVGGDGRPEQRSSRAVGEASANLNNDGGSGSRGADEFARPGVLSDPNSSGAADPGGTADLRTAGAMGSAVGTTDPGGRRGSGRRGEKTRRWEGVSPVAGGGGGVGASTGVRTATGAGAGGDRGRGGRRRGRRREAPGRRAEAPGIPCRAPHRSTNV